MNSSKLFLAAICCMLFIPSRAQYSLNEPRISKASPLEDELIVEYRLLSNESLVRGGEIVNEHDAFIAAFESTYDLEVISSKAVYQSVVDRMVLSGYSEAEVQREVFQTRAGRTGLEVRNLPALKNLELCRNLRLRLSAKNAATLREVIQNQMEAMADKGFVIKSIELNSFLSPSSRVQNLQNDPLLAEQWSHNVTNASVAWEVERGNSGVIIGIIDSGVNNSHEDLRDNLIEGFDFVDFNIDQFENWEIVQGEDYENRDRNPSDADGHGTFVAGIAAATQGNGLGISGVCPECSIMPLRAGARFYTEEDGDTLINTLFAQTDIADAIVYAVNEGADIINLSLGGTNRWGSANRNALTYAEEQGVVVVAAAGNEGTSSPVYPALYSSVIAVANTLPDDTKAPSSSYGSWVDVSAPGTSVISTVPRNTDFGSILATSLSYNNQRLQPSALTFTGFTTNEGVSAQVNYIGLAREGDITNAAYNWDLKDKIALILRGEITFKEKVDRAKEYGAVGAIIFDNVSGGSISWTLGEVQANPIPVLGISQAEGQEMLSLIRSGSNITASMSIVSFNGYSISTGTSFSAPYVAGMAGLLLSQEPGLSPAQVKARIEAATDNIDNRNLQYSGELGSGRVNLAKLFQATPNEEDILADNIHLYPNPTNGIVFIDLPEVLSGQWKINNSLGQTVAAEAFQQRTALKIDMAHLNPGLYFLAIEDQERLIVKRVMKR